jgi:hypothetical protein
MELDRLSDPLLDLRATTVTWPGLIAWMNWR